MITLREATVGVAVVVAMALLTLLGQWLSTTAPELLSTWRFVNGAIILFTLVVLLFKWDSVRNDLRTHREEITRIFLRMEKYLEEDAQRRSVVIEELTTRAAQVASDLARHNEQLSAQRHAELPHRIAEAIAKREDERRQAGEGKNGDSTGPRDA